MIMWNKHHVGMASGLRLRSGLPKAWPLGMHHMIRRLQSVTKLLCHGEEHDTVSELYVPLWILQMVWLKFIQVFLCINIVPAIAGRKIFSCKISLKDQTANLPEAQYIRY